MNDSTEELVSALREELKHYGEMLALLERQQNSIMTRAAHEVFQSISIIKVQTDALQTARASREECRRLIAEKMAQAPDISFADLIAGLPEEYRPLLKALVDENNQLLVRVRQRARQNHLLLHRSVELMQGVINALIPTRSTSVYTDRGDLAVGGCPTRRLCNAVG